MITGTKTKYESILDNNETSGKGTSLRKIIDSLRNKEAGLSSSTDININTRAKGEEMS